MLESRTLILIAIAIIAIIVIGAIVIKPQQSIEKKVVVYVAHDQDISEPIIKEFEEVSGIKVQALYDTEATKTVGLVNRLIAEKNNPQADVFWNNEPMRTIKLLKEGILQPYCSPNREDIDVVYKDQNCYWTGFGARARVIIYNTNFVSEEEKPISIFNLTNPKWREKVCIANPLMGSTSTHMAALFALLGSERAKSFLLALKENKIQVVESNSMVRDEVVLGRCWVGLTDTDDAYDAIKEGKAIKMVFPDQFENGIGTLVFPNTIMLINGGKNTDNAKKFIDFILSSRVEEELAKTALQLPLKKSSRVPQDFIFPKNIKPYQITFEEISNKLEESKEFLQNTFLK